MNSLKKLALATAIASAPFTVNALEALDDEFLGEVTGQEGITIETDTLQTIEEFQYVDGDGDGSGVAGKIKATGIKIGQFSDDFNPVDLLVNGAPNGLLNYDASGATSSYTRTSIDAASNGVLITTEQVGQAGTLLWSTGDTLPDGSTALVDYYSFGNGQDTYVGGIEIGNENNALNSIGELTILNTSNFINAGLIAGGFSKFGLDQQMGAYDASGNFDPTSKFAALLGNVSANVATNGGFIEAQTLISSKASGTGVHIATESSSVGGEAIIYTDTDGGAGTNQIGVLEILSFRVTETNDLSASNDIANGEYVRGSKTEFDLDVEGGKLVLSNYKSEGNTVINKIFIGDANAAMTTGAGVLGGIAILGNTTEGTISISAH